MACIRKIIIFLAGLLKMKPDNENLSHLTEKKQKRFLGTAISSTIKLLKSKKCRRKIEKREEEKEEKLKKSNACTLYFIYWLLWRFETKKSL